MTTPAEAVDLDFPTEDTLYACHGLHAFAAKCPPQLVRWGLEQFAQRGDAVLDPMCGSGTTLVEARLFGCQGTGLDIDPLSRLLAKVKATPIEPARLAQALDAVLNSVENDDAPPPDPPAVDRLDYWFLPEVAGDLARVKKHILESQADAHIQDFLLVAFSSLILARTSVANARDIVHSRQHYYSHATPPNVVTRFRARLRTMARMMTEYWALCREAGVVGLTSQVLSGDARRLPMADNSVDLVFTSPPYCNALDYTRAHALAVAWLQDVLETTPADYRILGRRYIGTERAKTASNNVGPIPGIPRVEQLIRKVEVADRHKANIVRRYFQDMSVVLQEITRVLRPNRHLVVVVCPSHIRKVDVPTHEVFDDMANAFSLPDGFRLRPVRRIERTIHDGRRLLPYMQETFGRRMKTEYVLIYQKSM